MEWKGEGQDMIMDECKNKVGLDEMNIPVKVSVPCSGDGGTPLHTLV